MRVTNKSYLKKNGTSAAIGTNLLKFPPDFFGEE
jgi:hypothetical protein